MDNSSLIDGYLRGELMGGQLTRFEEMIEVDVDFKSKFEERKEAYNLIKKSRAIELKLELKEINKEYQNKKNSGTNNLLKYLAIAIFLAAGVFLVQKYLIIKQSNSEQLYAETFEVYPMDFATRGDSFSDLVLKAKMLYDDEKFEKVVPILKEIIAGQEYDGKWYLFLASAYYKTDQSDLAVQTLKQIIDNQDQLYLDQASEYLDLISKSSLVD